MPETGAATYSRPYFILTAVSAAGGLVLGITAAADVAHAATFSKQPWTDSDRAPHQDFAASRRASD